MSTPLQRFAFATSVALAIFFSVGMTARAQVCHLVLFGDTLDKNIGVSVGVDTKGVMSLFAENLPRAQLRVTRVEGPQLSKQRMLDTIRKTRVGKNDALIVYFAGHGAYDPKQGHYFVATPSAKTESKRYLLRDDVRAAMKARGARLNVLMSDCCSNVRKLRKAVGAPTTKSVVAQAPPAFVSLLLKPQGFVDISSSSPGQVAMGDDANGGYFTRTFRTYISDNLRKNLTWKKATGDVSRLTALKFEKTHPMGIRFRSDGKSINQRTQTPKARLELGNGDADSKLPPLPPPTRNGPRFGVRAKQKGSRLVITQVVARSPATRVYVGNNPQPLKLEVGDVIVSINGRRISTERQYGNAVDNSGRRMKIQVLNVKDGKTYDVTVYLAR